MLPFMVIYHLSRELNILCKCIGLLKIFNSREFVIKDNISVKKGRDVNFLKKYFTIADM